MKTIVKLTDIHYGGDNIGSTWDLVLQARTDVFRNPKASKINTVVVPTINGFKLATTHQVGGQDGLV